MYFKLETRDFLSFMEDQIVTEAIIVDSLQECYTKCAFSTFPYIIHNYNSKEAI